MTQTWRKRYESPTKLSRLKKFFNKIHSTINYTTRDISNWINYHGEIIIIIITVLSLSMAFILAVQLTNKEDTKMEDIKIPIYFNESNNGTMTIDTDIMREEFEEKLEKARIEIEGS